MEVTLRSLSRSFYCRSPGSGLRPALMRCEAKAGLRLHRLKPGPGADRPTNGLRLTQCRIAHGLFEGLAQKRREISDPFERGRDYHDMIVRAGKMRRSAGPAPALRALRQLNLVRCQRNSCHRNSRGGGVREVKAIALIFTAGIGTSFSGREVEVCSLYRCQA